MRSIAPFPSILIFLLVSASFGTGWGSSQNIERKSTNRFDVGVILDLDTWLGKISWSCISMAIDDFYAAHPSYITKLVLHLKDSKEDVISAASAALSLIEDLQVQAIIGPQTSTQAKFIAEMGSKSQTPVISFSATSAWKPYSVQAAVSDSTQARAVSDLVRSFGWTELIPIFEDSDYGIGMIPHIIDAFRTTETRILYCSKISPNANDEEIIRELHNLKNTQTRVFVVHASNSLASRLFLEVREAGMTGNGYAWIVTHGLTDLMEFMDASTLDAIEGVLTFKPYISKSAVHEDFNNRWREQFHREYPTVRAKLPHPNIHSLWAYDTVWALAMAAEKLSLGRSEPRTISLAGNYSTDLERLVPRPNGSSLLNFMSSTKFKGASGDFQLVHGKLDSAMKFEIVDIREGKIKRLGFWTKERGISRNLVSNTSLKRVVLQGNSMSSSIEVYQGKKLRIGVPGKLGGWKAFINDEWNPLTKRNGSGFVIEVFEMLIKMLDYRVDYEYIFFKNSNGELNTSYDDLIYQVYLKNLDAVVGDVAITPFRIKYVDFTEPYFEPGMSMVVPIESYWDAWVFVKPLTTPLWLAIGAFFVYTGIVVWVLEHRSNEYFSGTPLRQVGNTLYFSFSTMVYAHREKLTSNFAKVVVVIWLFAVLILTSSYTANFSSMITLQRLHPTVTTIQDIIKGGGFLGYGGNYQFFSSLNIDPSRVRKYNTPEGYDEALTKGTISAMIDEIPLTKYFLSMYCGKYTTVGDVYKSNGFGFVFPKGSSLAYDISREILKYRQGIDKKFVWTDTTCSKQDSGTASRLTLYNFYGLFLVTGVASTLSLILYILCFLYERRHVLLARNSGRSMRQRLANALSS